jgi:hypothetical protein
MDEPLAWVRSVGLDVARLRPLWKIHVELATTGDIPGPVWDLVTPRFTLNLRPWHWVVGLCLEGQWFHYGKANGKPGAVADVDGDGHIQLLELTPPRKLATLRVWLDRTEKKLDLRFRRDRPRIRSDVKRGAAAMAMWIAGRR